MELCAEAGADILSIESIGGKEVHDQALMYEDFQGIVFALGVLAPRDMSWLWHEIYEICARHPGVVPGGDSACGFANTAVQLAHQKMLPEVLAAVVRAMSAVTKSGRVRAGSIRPIQRLCLRGSGHQGNHWLSDLDGREVGQLRAFQTARQHCCRDVRFVEQ
jgi:methanol--5-hydroxybenzimidazolylcobamide Co-methyltransferase